MRGIRQFVAVTAFAAFLFRGASDAVAQRPPSSSSRRSAGQRDLQQQREQAERMTKAQRELLQQEQAAFTAAAQQIEGARVALRTAGKDLRETKEKVAERLEESLGLKKALAEQAAAQENYKRAAEPVLSELKASDEFRKAESEAAAARAAINAAREDTSLTEADRRAKTANLINDSLTVSNLERLTLRKNSAVNSAREAFEAAQQRVADLRKKASNLAEKDSGIKAAEVAVSTASASLKDAEVNLAQVRAQASAAERSLQAGIIPKGGDKRPPAKGNDGKGPAKK